MRELSDLPRRMDRRLAAQVLSDHFFPVSPRTLERWPLNWRRINGRALADTEEFLAEAQRRVADAHPVRGGQ